MNQKPYVIKLIYINEMKDQEIKDTLVEAQIMQKLGHPNIIKFIETFIMNKHKKSLCIVMDYADGGDLKQRILRQKGRLFHENQIIDWFTQICLAIKHIHDRKILHRDLKSQNIFVTRNDMIKLGDFGIAKALENTMQKVETYIGTPYYLSPEIIKNSGYSFKSDIWSLGVLLYEMCSLKMPFESSNLSDLVSKISKGLYKPIPSSYSTDLKRLVSSLLNSDQEKRPSVNEILKLPLIRSRINKFLSEIEISEEFSHTILHNYNPLMNIRKNSQEPISPEVIKERKYTQPKKPITNANSNNNGIRSSSGYKDSNIKNSEYNNKISELIKSNSIKNNIKKPSNFKPSDENEKQNNQELKDCHEMIDELKKINSEVDIGSQEYDQSIEELKISLRRQITQEDIDQDKHTVLTELIQAVDIKSNEIHPKKPVERSESIEFSELRKDLISSISEPLLEKSIEIIDKMIPENSLSYDHESFSKAIISLTGEFDIKLILNTITRIHDIFRIVINRRIDRSK